MCVKEEADFLLLFVSLEATKLDKKLTQQIWFLPVLHDVGWQGWTTEGLPFMIMYKKPGHTIAGHQLTEINLLRTG